MVRLVGDCFSILIIEDPRGSGKHLMCSVLDDGDVRSVRPCFLGICTPIYSHILAKEFSCLFSKKEFKLEDNVFILQKKNKRYPTYYGKVRNLDKFIKTHVPGETVDVYALKNRQC